jgi:hypothetical protein
MELEKGMYVRTLKGIAKIVTNDRIARNTDKEMTLLENFNGVLKKNVIKASYNIIDLIEVGDIITFNFSNDVYKVLCVPNKEVGLDDFYFEYDMSQEFEDMRMTPEMVKGQIKSIVTHEQFESKSYKVGD